MLKQLRQTIVQQLWQNYKASSSQMQTIAAKLQLRGIENILLDHFAIIDLPSPQSGIPMLRDLFALLGYEVKGQDYLPSKQNDFLWLAEEMSSPTLATSVLPQAVVADFRLQALPQAVRTIIEKYGSATRHCPLESIRELIKDNQMATASQLILDYLSGSDWPKPTVSEFQTVQAFNELLAWVLVFGRKPNHFTISVHLLNHFESLNEFNHFIASEVKFKLNEEGGIIKGDEKKGIAQSSTLGIQERIKLSDGEVILPTGFVEFAWRFPVKQEATPPQYWQDFYTGFVATHASHVVESLYGRK